MSTIKFCDKCGAILGEIKISFWNVEEIPYYKIQKDNIGRFELCPKCNKELEKWLKTKVNT